MKSQLSLSDIRQYTPATNPVTRPKPLNIAAIANRLGVPPDQVTATLRLSARTGGAYTRHIGGRINWFLSQRVGNASA
jgi:hypothetical protein